MSIPSYEKAVELALQEDLLASDVTTDATVDSALTATASAVAKQPLVACGGPILFAVFRKLDPSCELHPEVAEGRPANAGQVLWRVRGNARALLKAERTALNFAQRLSGIATLTQQFVDALPKGSHTRITDTRKTTPGLRALERYAVRIGGGHNHRDNLGSAVLIKDNHIIAAGGVTNAIDRARQRAPHTSKIEVEVTDMPMLQAALASQADIVMLDNFAAEQVSQAVELCRGKALVEVSGGITPQRVQTLAQSGVDIISVGALTHSAPAADISLRIAID